MKFNLKNVKPHTWVSIVMVAFVIINSILGAMGKPIIKFSEAQITYIVTAIMDILFIGFALYKNQSFTDFAQLVDEILYMMRDGKISKSELEWFIEQHKNTDRPIDTAEDTVNNIPAK